MSKKPSEKIAPGPRAIAGAKGQPGHPTHVHLAPTEPPEPSSSRAALTDPLISALRQVLVDELLRQSNGFMGFHPTTEGTPDTVSYFDGYFAITPVLVDAPEGAA